MTRLPCVPPAVLLTVAVLAILVALTGCGGPAVKCVRYEAVTEHVIAGGALFETVSARCVEYAVEGQP